MTRIPDHIADQLIAEADREGPYRSDFIATLVAQHYEVQEDAVTGELAGQEADAQQQDEDLTARMTREGLRLRARAEVDRVETRRLVAQALDNGLSQEVTARILHTSQPTLSRIARKIKAWFDPAEVSPAEVINRHFAGGRSARLR